MSENIQENEQIRQQASAGATMIDEVQEAMKRLRICPRKALLSLSHLRIDGARIEPIESQARRTGGNADVELAILTPAQSPSLSKPEALEYVAVKKLRFNTQTDGDRALGPFAHEVSLLNDLSHENVVKILGFVEDVDNGVAWMLFLWEKNGNLREFVRAANWELPERVSLIYDVARGLSYLHGRNPPICHGDLKSLNILVNSENLAVITDFGSARAIGSETEATVGGINPPKSTKVQDRTSTGGANMDPLKAELAESGEFITITGPAWTVRWAAPELLDGGLPSLESDIWAFGWICWEAVTGNFPFENENDTTNDVTIIWRIVAQDLPTLRNNAQLAQIKMLCSFMEDCLRVNANERPLARICSQVLSSQDHVVPLLAKGKDSTTLGSCDLLHALGWIQLRNCKSFEAQEYFRRALEASKSVGDELGQALALAALGEAYGQQGEYSKAEASHIQARDLYSKIGSQLGLAQSTRALGDVYRMQNQLSKAEESYILSRDLFSKIGDPLGFAASVRALGEVYRMRNEDSKAEESYIQSRDLSLKIGDQLGFANSVQSLGDVYVGRKEYSKAEESYSQSRDLYSKIGSQLSFTHSVKALGDVYYMKGEYSKAEKSFIQSRDLYSQIDDQLGLAQSLKAIGHLHKARREFAKAEESYWEALRIYHRIGDKYSSANIYWYLAWLLRRQAKVGEAERLVREASALYTELGLRKRVADCDEFLQILRPFIKRI